MKQSKKNKVQKNSKGGNHPMVNAKPGGNINDKQVQKNEPEKMFVYIKMLTGDTTIIYIEPNDTIETLKNKIYEQMKIPIEKQRLNLPFAFNLQNSKNKTMNDFNIKIRTTIHLNPSK